MALDRGEKQGICNTMYKDNALYLAKYLGYIKVLKNKMSITKLKDNDSFQQLKNSPPLKRFQLSS